MNVKTQSSFGIEPGVSVTNRIFSGGGILDDETLKSELKGIQVLRYIGTLCISTRKTYFDNSNHPMVAYGRDVVLDIHYAEVVFFLLIVHYLIEMILNSL